MSILDILALDSGNRNIYQQTGARNSTAQGFFQITNKNWRAFAPARGITAPNALSATPREQAVVAADLFNFSGGATNWGVGQWWGLQSIKNYFAANPGGTITEADINAFAASHGDYSGSGPAAAAMAQRDPSIDPFAAPFASDMGIPNANTETFAQIPDTSLGSGSSDTRYVAAPEGYGSGLTAGVYGERASDINIPPDNPETATTGLSVGTRDLGGSRDISGDAIIRGVQDTQGALGGIAQNLTDAQKSMLVPNLFSDIVIFLKRSAVVILGLVLIALAAGALVRQSGGVLPGLGKGTKGI